MTDPDLQTELSKSISTGIAAEDHLIKTSSSGLVGHSLFNSSLSPNTNQTAASSSHPLSPTSEFHLSDNLRCSFDPISHFDVIMRLYSCYRLSLDVLFLAFDLLRRVTPSLTELTSRIHQDSLSNHCCLPLDDVRSLPPLHSTTGDSIIVGQPIGRTSMLTVNLAGALCLSLAQKYEKRVTFNIQSCSPDWLNLDRPLFPSGTAPEDNAQALRESEFEILLILGFRIRSTENVFTEEEARNGIATSVRSKSEPLSPYETLLHVCSRLPFLNSAHMSQTLRATIKDLALHLLF